MSAKEKVVVLKMETGTSNGDAMSCRIRITNKREQPLGDLEPTTGRFKLLLGAFSMQTSFARDLTN